VKSKSHSFLPPALDRVSGKLHNLAALPPKKEPPANNNKRLSGFQGQYRHWTDTALAMLEIKPQFLTCTQPRAHQLLTMLSKLPNINLQGTRFLYIVLP
jgi:hypothetical protein